MSRVLEINESLKKWNGSIGKGLKDDGILTTVAKFSSETYSVTFSVDPVYDGAKNCSLLVPENYPKGNYTFVCDDNMKEFRGGDMYEVMNKVVKKFRIMRKKALEETASPTPNPLDDSEEEMEDPFLDHMGDEDSYEDESEGEGYPVTPSDVFGGFGTSSDYPDAKKNFEELVLELNKHNHDGLYCKKGASGIDNFRVYLIFDPKKRLCISELVSNCWGIDLSKYIVVSLTLSSYNFYGIIVPEIRSYQAGITSVDPNSSPMALGEEQAKYGLSWTVSDRLLKDFFKKNELTRFGRIANGVNQHKSFLHEAILFVERTIKSSPYYCIVCGVGLEHVGIKPTVCSSPLCVFSHEEYGLGCDLESEIVKNSDVVDMLITVTASAAAAPKNKGHNPFNPFPYGIEVKVTLNNSGGRKPTVLKMNFLDINGERDNGKVLDVVSKIPSINRLKSFVNRGKLKVELDKIDRRMYALLRWIVSSNRCHLHRLVKSNSIEKMQTEYQYIMMSGTAEKEREFNELKEKYGSIQAWHGSPLYNWHSILRIGLKNMSGKKGQLHGAAYGNGVYFAKDSRSSFSYMKFHSSWVNSQFNNSQLGMLALCEIINHPNYKGQPNPFYVIPEESHMQTRLFFVYPKYSQVNCLGSSVKIPKVRWWAKKK